MSIETTTPATSLGHFPEGQRWEFDQSVTQVFDDMLARSIPQYQTMRELVTDMAVPFVMPDTTILDLGCSRGEALEPFIRRFGAHNRYVGLDVSAPMLDAARERYASLIRAGMVEIREHDLRNGVPHTYPSVILSVLTLMFVPINHRQKIVRDAFQSLKVGGALILVEKVLGDGADIDGLLVDRYHRMKAENGYTSEEISRKALALEGVQVPVTAGWNEDLLRSAGFRAVDCFWRWCNFAGWIAIKTA